MVKKQQHDITLSELRVMVAEAFKSLDSGRGIVMTDARWARIKCEGRRRTRLDGRASHGTNAHSRPAR